MESPIPRKAPPRTNSRKRVRRPPTAPSDPQQRQRQINAYYDLKKNSPALKAARITRMKRLQAAKWAAAQAQIPLQWRAFMVVARVIIMTLVLFIFFRIMLAEKQLLQLRNILTLQRGAMHQTKMSWRSFQHAYETRFHRPAIPAYETWLTYAQNELCEPFKDYNAIERDVLPFRHLLQAYQQEHHHGDSHKKFHWHELEAIATNYTKGAFLLVQIHDNKLDIIQEEWEDWIDQHPTLKTPGLRATWEAHKVRWNLKWLLDPVVNHQPPLSIRFVINLHHLPKLPQHAQVPIFSSHHLHYHTDNDPVHPGNDNLEIANKNRNGVTDPRDTTTRDLLLPHLYLAGGRMGAAGMTSSPAIGGFWFWPFFRDGKPWQKRDNAIAWRGSTLGNYNSQLASSNYGDVNATQQFFFTGPRFELMRRWGGQTVHPISRDVPIDVDFAFTRLIVQGEDHMSNEQWYALQANAKQKYRFARRMNYWKMQQYKYLLDVDSNAFSVRFSALLRTGSLVFKTTRYREWYSERLRNWKDFIPVNYDTSDLHDKLRWVHQQPPEVIENIIRHGKATVQSRIRPEDMQCYTYRMMLEYSTLFEPLTEAEASQGAAATTGTKSAGNGGP